MARFLFVALSFAVLAVAFLKVEANHCNNCAGVRCGPIPHFPCRPNEELIRVGKCGCCLACARKVVSHPGGRCNLQRLLLLGGLEVLEIASCPRGYSCVNGVCV